MADKLSKVVVAYLDRTETPISGTHCGACRDFIQLSKECMIVDPPNVSAERGDCIYFLHGRPNYHGVPRRLISKPHAGYIEGREVPAYCGHCQYYAHPERPTSPCEKVEGSVDYGGCCNAYEARKEGKT